MSQTPPTQRKDSNNSGDVGNSPQESRISSARMRHNNVSNASKRHSSPMIIEEAVPTFETNGHLPLSSSVSAPSNHSLTAKRSGNGSALTGAHNGEEEAVDGASNVPVAAQMKKMGSGSASVELGMLGRNPTPVSRASQSSEELPVFTGQGVHGTERHTLHAHITSTLNIHTTHTHMHTHTRARTHTHTHTPPCTMCRW